MQIMHDLCWTQQVDFERFQQTIQNRPYLFEEEPIMKKLLALVVTLVLVMSLATVACAAE